MGSSAEETTSCLSWLFQQSRTIEPDHEQSQVERPKSRDIESKIKAIILRLNRPLERYLAEIDQNLFIIHSKYTPAHRSPGWTEPSCEDITAQFQLPYALSLLSTDKDPINYLPSCPMKHLLFNFHY